jgi:hypothetical protein
VSNIYIDFLGNSFYVIYVEVCEAESVLKFGLNERENYIKKSESVKAVLPKFKSVSP